MDIEFSLGLMVEYMKGSSEIIKGILHNLYAVEY